MSKKFSMLLAVVMIATLVLSACAPAATATQAPTTAAPTAAAATATTAAAPAATATTAPAAPTATTAAAPAATATTAATTAPAAAKIKGCLVTDVGGINDKSFNASAWKGLTDAQTKLGATVQYLQSKQQTDYEKNLQAYVDEKCDLIVTVGFLLGDATAAAAKANTSQKFAIVDYSYDPVLPNVLGLTFATDQAGFLAGYLAAGMTKTGKVGTFGGLQIPTVTIFEDGFYMGVQQYNKVHSKTVAVLGWDPMKKTGLFAGGFNDQDKGKQLAQSLMQEGADIIMPVAGAVGLGAAAAVKDSGKASLIGVDTDWTVTSPEYTSIMLTSVMKVIDVATFTAMQSAADGSFKGGNYVGTLANKGVAIAPYHDFDSKVPADLKAEIEKLQADIIAGNVKTAP
ncbi:MAG TPA: BMP family ABC transporter substrate-binding protein [Anaerolineaceae bacterium]